MLTQQQIVSLDRYEKMQQTYPQLFRTREERPIVQDRSMLETYAAEHRIVLGVVAETPWFFFLNDLVSPAAAKPFPYSRLISRGQLEGGVNIAILAGIANPDLGDIGDIVLVEQERHATGCIELAIPRGFGMPDQDGPAAVLRELREETGFLGSDVQFLGESVIDSGAGDARVSFYRTQVVARVEVEPDSGELIRGVRLLAPDAFRRVLLSDGPVDGFSLQALALAGL